MVSLWKRLLAQNTERVRSFEHPHLGQIELDSEEDLWAAKVSVGGHTFRILFAGATVPDERLLTRGEAIVADFERIALKVHDLLEAEAISRPRYAQEIRQLKISDVGLLWPDRPGEGMIYFKGPDRFRVWRCDYVDSAPRSLGFDT